MQQTPAPFDATEGYLDDTVGRLLGYPTLLKFLAIEARHSFSRDLGKIGELATEMTFEQWEVLSEMSSPSGIPRLEEVLSDLTPEQVAGLIELAVEFESLFP